MEFDVLQSDIQEFINKNIGSEIKKLALQKNPFPETDWISILNQVASKSKSKTKLPTWFNCKNIVYPNKISIEQSSSEAAAEYKSSLVSGASLIDLSGGFGVDCYYFAKKINSIFHCEINSVLSQIVDHNFKQLNQTNIECFTGNGIEILQRTNQNYDWIYIDPSRRNDLKGKVFMLQDCLPNVPENLDLFFRFSNKILIKTAPLLDISAGLLELKNVKTIHIVAIENEVKELLWEIHKDYTGDLQIKTIAISKQNKVQFDFVYTKNQPQPKYSSPQKYLYEPNNAIMKSGGFNQVGIFYELNKLHQHSHLFTNDTLINFPGRIFTIESVIDYTKQQIEQFLKNKQFNITVRNFPETVENIRKKWKIKEGGNQYCFFTTDLNNHKIVLICTKI